MGTSELNAAAEVLSKASYYVREDGWCRGELRDAKGRLCAVGAIFKAKAHSVWGGEDAGLHFRAMDVARNLLPESNQLWRWNDEPGGTKREVERLLLDAASLAMDGEEVG